MKLPPHLRDGRYRSWEFEMAARYSLALSEMRSPSKPPDTFETEPLARWGVEIHAGWRPIMEPLLDRLEAVIAEQAADQRDRFRIIQAKEKFGRLTVYLASEAPPEIEAVLRDAADGSVATCEVCGAPGKLEERNARWAARCAAHETWTLGPPPICRTVSLGPQAS